MNTQIQKDAYASFITKKRMKSFKIIFALLLLIAGVTLVIMARENFSYVIMGVTIPPLHGRSMFVLIPIAFLLLLVSMILAALLPFPPFSQREWDKLASTLQQKLLDEVRAQSPYYHA